MDCPKLTLQCIAECAYQVSSCLADCLMAAHLLWRQKEHKVDELYWLLCSDFEQLSGRVTPVLGVGILSASVGQSHTLFSYRAQQSSTWLGKFEFSAITGYGFMTRDTEYGIFEQNWCRGGTTRVVQYGAIDHVPSYKLSRGVVLFSANCTTRVVPPLESM